MITVLIWPPEIKLLMPIPAKRIPVPVETNFIQRGSFLPAAPCTVLGIDLLSGCRSRYSSKIFKGFFVYVDAELFLKFLELVFKIMFLKRLHDHFS